MRSILDDIARYNLPHDYIKQREGVAAQMTGETLRALAQKYIAPDKMIFLVVGDAATQLEPLKKLDLAEPIILDQKGNLMPNKGR